LKATNARRQLRAILAGKDCIEPASLFDPISGRIAEQLGFECGLFGGSCASMTVLASPDIALVTMTEVVEQIRRIARSCSVPIIVDADHGYGNALSVMRTIEDLEAAGASGISIEDTLLPMPFGGYGPQPDAKLVSIEETVGKLRAALAARQDDSLVIMGRTIVPSTASTQDLVNRCKAYAETGVDGIFLVLTQTREQLEAVAANVKVPIVVGGYTPELDDPAYLASQGARLYFQKHDPLLASIRAVYDTMAAQRQRRFPGISAEDAALARRVVRTEGYEDWAEKFLSSAAPREKWR